MDSISEAKHSTPVKSERRTRQPAKKNLPKRSPRLNFFGGGSFNLISDELRKSTAYLSLNPSARLVLLDMIGAYNKASGGDKERLDGEGFLYTPKRCRENVSYNTFYDAVKAIIKRGFFCVPPELQGDTVAQPRYFVPSRQWVHWTSSEAEKKVQAKRASIAKKCRRDSLRRAKFRQAPDWPTASPPSGPQRQIAVPKNGGI